MAFTQQEKAAVLATYLSNKDFNKTATIHSCSPLTVRNIHKEYLNRTTDDAIDSLTHSDIHLVTEVVRENAPNLLKEAVKIEKSTTSLDRLNTSSHEAGIAVMDKVKLLALKSTDVSEILVLSDAIFKVNQAFFSQGMQVNIQQNNVDSNALTTALGFKK